MVSVFVCFVCEWFLEFRLSYHDFWICNLVVLWSLFSALILVRRQKCMYSFTRRRWRLAFIYATDGIISCHERQYALYDSALETKSAYNICIIYRIFGILRAIIIDGWYTVNVSTNNSQYYFVWMSSLIELSWQSLSLNWKIEYTSVQFPPSWLCRIGPIHLRMYGVDKKSSHQYTLSITSIHMYIEDFCILIQYNWILPSKIYYAIFCLPSGHVLF